MAIMGDNVFEQYARNPADAMASAFWGKRLDQQLQPNPDPWAREEERRRNQRLAEWELANSLPQHLANSVQNTMIARPDQMGLGLAGARAWDDISQARPMASQAMQDQMAAQFWGAYQPQPPAPRPTPVQPQVPMHNQAAAMQQAFSGALPGVGRGSVNGKDALYPIHGQVPQYQQSMMHLQADPNNISVFDPGALSAAMDGMQARDYQAKLAGSEADPKVIAARARAAAGVQIAELKTASDLQREITKGNFVLQKVEKLADGREKVHLLDAQSREKVAIINRDGRLEVANLNNASREKVATGHDNTKIQTTNAMEQGKSLRTGSPTVAPIPVVSAGNMQQAFNIGAANATAGNVMQGPGGQGQMVAPGMNVTSGLPAGPGVEYDNSHPARDTSYPELRGRVPQGPGIRTTPKDEPRFGPNSKEFYQRKLAPFAKQKLDAYLKKDVSRRAFDSMSDAEQMAYMAHILSGKI